MNEISSRQIFKKRTIFLSILFHSLVACVYVSFFHNAQEYQSDTSSRYIRTPETLTEKTQSAPPIVTMQRQQQQSPMTKASDANVRETKVLPTGGVNLKAPDAIETKVLPTGGVNLKASDARETKDLPTDGVKRPSSQKNSKINHNQKSNGTQEVRSISINNPNAPDIAWLMSYPNSGTTYTSLLIHELTHTTTANVYGSIYFARNRDERGNYKVIRDFKSSLPIYFDRTNGPYMLSDYPLPTRPSLSSLEKNYENHPLILTKTHCSGYCHDCTPARYISNKIQFFQGCRTGLKITVTDIEVQDKSNNQNANEETQQTITRETVRHDPTLVKKAVHLMRNPFDNVAARFHHAWKLGRTEEIMNIKDQFAFDTEGFHKYCAFLDKKYVPREKEWYSSHVFELAQRIPCHAEFYRYIQWHNLAFETTSETMDIPSVVISYEHYKHHLDVTIGRLLQFLNLQQVNFKAPKFEFNRYHFYTEEEKRDIFLFMKSIASEETWTHMRAYCEQDKTFTYPCT